MVIAVLAYNVPVEINPASNLLLNVFQSVELKAPVVLVLAKAKDKACVLKLKPLAVPIVTALCLAAVFAATLLFALTLASV